MTVDQIRHCNTLQHAATRCNTLQHAATRCNTLQHTATRCNTWQHVTARFVTHCDTHTWLGARAPCVEVLDIVKPAARVWSMCCSELQPCVAVSCSQALQWVAACRSILQCNACYSMLQCNTVCCSALQKVWMLSSHCTRLIHVLQRVAICYSMLQYVAVCCSVLQCVAV